MHARTQMSKNTNKHSTAPMDTQELPYIAHALAAQRNLKKHIPKQSHQQQKNHSLENNPFIQNVSPCSSISKSHDLIFL